MPTLFHHSFCPHSRFVRLALGEHSVAVRLIEERTWERRHDFLVLTDTEVIRAAKNNIRYHMAYIGWLVRARDWLAGDRLSYADLAAAAHLSAADYLGDVPWNEDEAAKNWYARVKSRPSFRPILAETLAGIPPSKTYADLDF